MTGKQVTVMEVAKFLGVGRAKVYKLIERSVNPLPAANLGEQNGRRLYRIDWDSFIPWYRSTFQNDVADQPQGNGAGYVLSPEAAAIEL